MPASPDDDTPSAIPVNASGGAGFTVNVAVLVTPPYEALIEVTVCAATADVTIGKLATALPAGTLTLAGTDTAALALDSDTATGAGALVVSVT